MLLRAKRARLRRGATLIEILIALGIVVLLSGTVFIGSGGLASSRLRQSTTMIVGAIRVAYNHASATSKPTRLVFDIEKRLIIIEEGSSPHLVQSGDRTGGAAAADDAEADAVAAGDAILEGPRAARARFSPLRVTGFDQAGSNDKNQQQQQAEQMCFDAGSCKVLARGIVFHQIEVDHEDGPVTDGRVYLYFWPGGQTQRAAIQLASGKEDIDENDILTVSVAPLTGKVSVDSGPVDMPRPRSDEEASERDDF